MFSLDSAGTVLIEYCCKADILRKLKNDKTFNYYFTLFRLKATRSEVGGWAPVVISFQHFYDKEAVLKRADMLDRSGLLITEDMSRSVRENWGELNKFMTRVSRRKYYFRKSETTREDTHKSGMDH